MARRRGARGGAAARKQRERAATPERPEQLPDGAREFPDGGLTWECPTGCSYACWRQTLPELLGTMKAHDCRRKVA
jgi:hypothetical protein